MPTVELTDIYRQADGSSIIEIAHMIKQGRVAQSTYLLKQRTVHLSKQSTDQIPKVVEQVVKNAISKGHSIKDIQVLAPMYRGPAGIDGLNKMIQEMVNPNQTETKRNGFW